MRFLVDYELLRGRFMENFKRNFSVYEIFQRCSLLAQCFEPVHRTARRCFLIVLSMTASNSLFFKLSTYTTFIVHQCCLGGLWFRFQFTRIIHFYILEFCCNTLKSPKEFRLFCRKCCSLFYNKSTKISGKALIITSRWINFSKRCTTIKRYSLRWMRI